jgi:hypothetical protein
MIKDRKGGSLRIFGLTYMNATSVFGPVELFLKVVAAFFMKS